MELESLKQIMLRMARRQGYESDSEDEEVEPCAPHLVEAVLLLGLKMSSIDKRVLDLFIYVFFR